MARPSPRSAITAIGVAAATLLLTGCFSLESSFVIHDDGTADVTLVTAIDLEQFERLSSLLGEELGPIGDLTGDALFDELMGDQDPCAELVGDLTDFDVTTEKIDEDGEIGVGCTVAGVPIDELTSAMSDVTQDGEPSFTITQDGDATHFSATLEGVDELAGDTGEMSQMTEILGIGPDDLFSITFSVTAPGSLGENNATSTSDSTATWDVTADAEFVTDGDAVMTADWSESSSSSSTMWTILGIVLGIIAAVLIVGAIIYFVRRRKRGTTGGEVPGTTAPAGPVLNPPVPTGAPTAPMASGTPPSSFAPPPASPPADIPPPPPSPSDIPPPPAAPPQAAPPPPPPPPPG